jgi:hypothetical protein
MDDHKESQRQTPHSDEVGRRCSLDTAQYIKAAVSITKFEELTICKDGIPCLANPWIALIGFNKDANAVSYFFLIPLSHSNQITGFHSRCFVISDGLQAASELSIAALNLLNQIIGFHAVSISPVA